MPDLQSAKFDFFFLLCLKCMLISVSATMCSKMLTVFEHLTFHCHNFALSMFELKLSVNIKYSTFEYHNFYCFLTGWELFFFDFLVLYLLTSNLSWMNFLCLAYVQNLFPGFIDQLMSLNKLLM